MSLTDSGVLLRRAAYLLTDPAAASIPGFSLLVSGPDQQTRLLLFGAVQTTMLGAGIAHGERPPATTWLGVSIAAAGLVALTLPGLHAPSLAGSVAMLGAGAAWGFYSLRGRRARDGLAATRDAFVRGVADGRAVSEAALHARTRKVAWNASSASCGSPSRRPQTPRTIGPWWATNAANAAASPRRANRSSRSSGQSPVDASVGSGAAGFIGRSPRSNSATNSAI